MAPSQCHNYLILTPAQMYEVGTRAAEHDVTDAPY